MSEVGCEAGPLTSAPEGNELPAWGTAGTLLYTNGFSWVPFKGFPCSSEDRPAALFFGEDVWFWKGSWVWPGLSDTPSMSLSSFCTSTPWNTKMLQKKCPVLDATTSSNTTPNRYGRLFNLAHEVTLLWKYGCSGSSHHFIKWERCYLVLHYDFPTPSVSTSIHNKSCC